MILFCRQLIYNYPEQLFSDNGVMSIEHADFEGVERLALVTGTYILFTWVKINIINCYCILTLLQEICSLVSTLKSESNTEVIYCNFYNLWKLNTLVIWTFFCWTFLVIIWSYINFFKTFMKIYKIVGLLQGTIIYSYCVYKFSTVI